MIGAVVVVKVPLSVNLAATVSTTPQTTGVSVAFTAAVTAGAETGIPIESFSWNFGDGVATTTSGTQTSHVYNAASSPAPNSATFQTYTVTVTVRTNDGRSGTARVEVQVKLLP